MRLKQIPLALAATSVALTSAAPVHADGDDLIGGLIGGIIAGAIINEASKKPSGGQKTTTTRTTKKRAPSAATVANRELQTALNFFGFDAGSPDGVLGRRTVAATSDYQAVLGYPVTGQLTEYERSLLLEGYHRAMAGGAATQTQIAASPMGARGLLIQYRDQRTAAAAMVPGATVPAAVPAAGQAPSGGALPSFFGGDTAKASLASHCNKVGLMTSSNGGFVTAASMSDPRLALSEQFCLARTYAIATGEEMEAKINGFTPEQIAQQCSGFGPAMKEMIAALSVQPRDEVVKLAAGFALSTGMSPAQLSGTAKVCLSVGYRTDNMDVALASGLLLASLGERPYAELLGHHLMAGFGTSERADLAQDWYDMGLEALEAGQTAAFAPGQPERPALVRQAVAMANGQPAPAADEVVAASAGAEAAGPEEATEVSGPAGFILFMSPNE